MAVYGLDASFAHPENGMTKADMIACQRVAEKMNEVIIFRSTGPWSMRWIERDYPTKNFHVKGKSSDWGPQAGFVPHQGVLSKVGGNAAKEDAGTAANEHGLKDGYTQKTQLSLTYEELQIQLTRKASGRTAIDDMVQIPNSKDYLLYANRSTDGKRFAFRAVWSPQDHQYKIAVYDNADAPRFFMFGARSDGKKPEEPKPLMVMTSSEAGANNKPLTGDYDLMAVCPTWGDYGSRSVKEISKPGVDFGRGGVAEPGQTFGRGANMDGVLDMRTNTGAKGQQVPKMKNGIPVIGPNGRPEMEWKTTGSGGVTASTYNKTADATPHLSREHNDMGNLTPRILRCVNELNIAMGQSGPLRRVHHNAESHRNVIFGGITAGDMEKGEALPLTVFQPSKLNMFRYSEIFTITTLGEFRNYALLLNEHGYYVPKSWVWGMSVRDQAAPAVPWRG